MKNTKFKTPILADTPIFSQGDYDVYVGTLEADRLAMYVVVNRNTEVVEYTSEVTLGYLSWLDGIAEASAQRKANLETPTQHPLDLSLAN